MRHSPVACVVVEVILQLQLLPLCSTADTYRHTLQRVTQTPASCVHCCVILKMMVTILLQLVRGRLMHHMIWQAIFQLETCIESRAVLEQGIKAGPSCS
jgi:hypothetical protein